MVVRQGDVFWVELGEPRASEPGYRHPHAVIQNDVFQLIQKIGTPSPVRVREILSGLRTITEPSDID
jgi:hypothetical protein